MTNIIMRTPAVLGRTAFDQLFDQFFNDPRPYIKRSTEGYPVTDIFQNDDGSQIIQMALAGFSEDDINIEVQDNNIKISCDSVNQSKEANRRIAKRSFSKVFTDYQNKLDLPRAKATFINGLLSVEIPQLLGTTPTIIKIN